MAFTSTTTTATSVVLLVLACTLASVQAVHNINDYAAVATTNTVAAAYANSKALTAAIAAAGTSTTDRTVLVPADSTYYFFTVVTRDLHNLTLQIEGTLIANNNITAWYEGPINSTAANTLGLFYFGNCSQISITGNGMIDGQGYDWWWKELLGKPSPRPHMVVMEQTQDISITYIRARNSPQFHFDIRDIKNLYVNGVDIMVDVDKQKELFRAHGHWDEEAGLPTFPLNTDGIDPSGINVLIENVTIQNFDDAIAVKPCSGQCTFSDCSQNMLIRNMKVTFGVGATIGSVPPHADCNCVKNITFENVEWHNAIKGIYIKTNPGDTGTGIIDGIYYKNMVMNGALWYPIWIGPQQQKQPGTSGTGCSFFYPISKTCPTNPRVPISNVVISNLTITKADTLPGVILCDPAKPCTNITFDSVTSQGTDVISRKYWCENAQVNNLGTTSPQVDCTNTNGTLLQHPLPYTPRARSDREKIRVVKK